MKDSSLHRIFQVEASRLEPVYSAIRSTPPSDEDLILSNKLITYMEKSYPTENEKNMQRRSYILTELREIFRQWIKTICIQKGLSEEISCEAGGQIYVSGSYRLGVNEKGADIDTICVAPQHVTREDFFTSLKEIFLKHPKVSNLLSIESAAVPIMTFDYEEINIDLQIAILPRNTIPDDLNILDDQILANVDRATEKSLNGPRVTELLIQLTPNRESFIIVLRLIRHWAKKRGLYSNKMGYLGGVNWCILVCFVNQLYPTSAPATLLLRFFMVLSNWKWPLAIQLCKAYDAKLGLEVWSASNGSNRFHTMPILTPAYPSMNSSYNVSPHTLGVMKEEFRRALAITQKIIHEKNGEGWEELFEESDFFAICQHYLAVDVYVTDQAEEGVWVGFCESRLRKLVASLAHIPPLCRIRAFPRKFPLYAVGEHAMLPSASEERGDGGEGETVYGVCFFIGFDVDRARMRNAKELRIDSSVDYFKENELRYPRRTAGMQVKISAIPWKNLPDQVFENINGREKAKEIRRNYLRKKKEQAELAAATGAKIVNQKILQDKMIVKTEEINQEENPIEGLPATPPPMEEEAQEEERTPIPPVEISSPVTKEVPIAKETPNETPIVNEAPKESPTPKETLQETLQEMPKETPKENPMITKKRPLDKGVIPADAPGVQGRMNFAVITNALKAGETTKPKRMKISFSSKG